MSGVWDGSVALPRIQEPSGVVDEVSDGLEFEDDVELRFWEETRVTQECDGVDRIVRWDDGADSAEHFPTELSEEAALEKVVVNGFCGSLAITQW